MNTAIDLVEILRLAIAQERSAKIKQASCRLAADTADAEYKKSQEEALGARFALEDHLADNLP